MAKALHVIENYFLAVALICIALLPLAPFILLGLHFQNKRDLRESRTIIDQHSLKLAIRKNQLVYERDYDLVETRLWEAEKATFIAEVILPHLERQYVPAGFARRLDDMIDTAASARMPEVTRSLGIEPLEYEEFVASMLRRAGWQACTTKATGDQGIDVIAQKNARRLVVQCKMQKDPVGTAAVQQIIAGREFKAAHLAAVVSNAGYTRGARQLAAAAGVKLLHDQEVSSL